MNDRILHSYPHNIFAGFSNKNYERAKFLVLGVPLDVSGTFRGGYKFAPLTIRNSAAQIELKSLRYNTEVSDSDVYDLGDIVLGSNIEYDLRVIEESIKELSNEKKVIALIGGEHTITYSVAKALSIDKLLIFDAHFDLREEYIGSKISHATWLRRLLETKLSPENVLIVGVRATSKDEELSRPPKVLSINSLQFRSGQVETVEEWIDYSKRYYVSIDMDCFDPAYAPGVGNPEPEGIEPSTFFDFLFKFIRPLNVIGFDVCEVVPPYDPSGITSILAAKVIVEMFNMILSKEL